jgi:hypothetical protein
VKGVNKEIQKRSAAGWLFKTSNNIKTNHRVISWREDTYFKVFRFSLTALRPRVMKEPENEDSLLQRWQLNALVNGADTQKVCS